MACLCFIYFIFIFVHVSVDVIVVCSVVAFLFGFVPFTIYVSVLYMFRSDVSSVLVLGLFCSCLALRRYIL